jgi:hypothetical protein
MRDFDEKYKRETEYLRSSDSSRFRKYGIPIEKMSRFGDD